MPFRIVIFPYQDQKQRGERHEHTGFEGKKGIGDCCRILYNLLRRCYQCNDIWNHHAHHYYMDVFKMIPSFDPSYNAPELHPRQPDIRDDRKNGWRWWRLRRAYLRERPWCERCGLLGEEVHHIIPRHVDHKKIYDWNNLMTLCSFCHAKEHGFGE